MGLQEHCTLDALRLDVSVHGSTSVNENGEGNEGEAIDSLMANMSEWEPVERTPYFCSACGRYFEEWEDAKAHLIRLVGESAIRLAGED